ncbi:MAG: hypothetical protein CL916_08750 [Deltaproteobacteria bacterium]|nr:hypothetical protein [Deltaproteobacteria bacterium]
MNTLGIHILSFGIISHAKKYILQANSANLDTGSVKESLFSLYMGSLMYKKLDFLIIRPVQLIG